MRPPYGSIDGRVRAILAAMDVVPITWDVDSNDWQMDSYPASPGYPAVNPTMSKAQVVAAWAVSLNASHPNGFFYNSSSNWTYL